MLIEAFKPCSICSQSQMKYACWTFQNWKSCPQSLRLSQTVKSSCSWLKHRGGRSNWPWQNSKSLITRYKCMQDIVPQLSGLSPLLNCLRWIILRAQGERQFTLIMKFECIAFTSFLHKTFSFPLTLYIKCIILYIEKLIFNTCAVCSRKHIDLDRAERGLELLLWFRNQTQHFFHSSKSMNVILFSTATVCVPHG